MWISQRLAIPRFLLSEPFIITFTIHFSLHCFHPFFKIAPRHHDDSSALFTLDLDVGAEPCDTEQSAAAWMLLFHLYYIIHPVLFFHIIHLPLYHLPRNPECPF